MLSVRTKRAGTTQVIVLREDDIRSIQHQLVIYGFSLEEVLQYFCRVTGKSAGEVAVVLEKVPRLAVCLS